MLIKRNRIDFLFLHSIGLIFSSILDIYNSKLIFSLAFGAISFSYYIIQNWDDFTTHKKWGGFPNLITTSRLLLLFTTPFITTNLNLGIMTLLIISLDGLDGFIARKLNQVTNFGGLIDMEVDAYFCLIFSIIIFLKYPELEWILIGGLLRYLYKIITFTYSKSKFEEKKKKYARFIAGFYFTSFPLFFLTDYTLGFYIISAGTIFVSLSFFISFYEFFTFKK